MSFITTVQTNLVKKIAAILTTANEKLAVAESSTGGLVSACLLSMPDEVVKSRKSTYFVIPVKTGIQCLQYVT